MNDFKSKRVSYSYTQTNHAAPERVFPLLCPVREAEWLPGWRYRLIYSESGVAELGCVFTTPNDDGSEMTWVITDYDRKAFRIAFAWVWPQMLATRLNIQLRAAGPDRTHADISYTYTGLSETGNAVVHTYTEAWFQARMQGWETLINRFLGGQADATSRHA